MGIQQSRFVDRNGMVYLPYLTEWKQVSGCTCIQTYTMYIHAYSREQEKGNVFLVWYCYGTGTVLLRFARGMVEVHSRYCEGSLEVLRRFARGTAKVRSRYCEGSLEVLATRYGRKMQDVCSTCHAHMA